MSGSLRVGLDLGGTKCLGIALDADRRIVAELRRPTPVGASAIVDTLAGLVGELQRAAPPGPSGPATVVSVGVGAPGLVDRSGVLRVAPNLPGITGLPLEAELERRLGLPVEVDNDATLAAWGEHQLGAGRGLDDMVMVALGTGIGGGIVADGRLRRGSNGFAGEVGHMVVDPNGPPCPCGGRGCWERFASGSGLAQLAREAAAAGEAARIVALAGGDPADVRGEHVADALVERDGDAAQILGRFAWWIALGLSNLTSIFDPEAFVVGGGLIDLRDTLLGPVRDAFDAMLLGGPARPPVKILPAQLGERAGAIGAATL